MQGVSKGLIFLPQESHQWLSESALELVHERYQVQLPIALVNLAVSEFFVVFSEILVNTTNIPQKDFPTEGIPPLVLGLICSQ